MDQSQEYQKALDYIYSFIDYSLTRNLRNLPDKFDLARMHLLMEKLNNPQEQYAIFHVAGTKGKGSVSAMISNALRYSGNKVGLYTSPHLVEFNERIQINGIHISQDDLVKTLDKMKPAIEQIEHLSMFEITTALALLYFAHAGVDVAVLEVGLGGRLDATNVVLPDVSVITSISYDHTAVLGSTLSEISFEKAGIIKEGRPVVVAPQKDEANLVFRKVAMEKHSPLVQVGKDFLYAPFSHTLEGQTLLVWADDEQALVNQFIESGGRDEWEPVRLYIPLLGYHQVENAATAYTALQAGKKAGIRITEEGIKQGFENVNWPGRFEILRRNPPIIIDSAHNRDSALKLRLTMDDYFPGLPIILVFGAAEDKDIHGMFSELLPNVRQMIATKSIHPRAAVPDQLVEMAHRFGKAASAIVPIEEAIKQALEIAGSECVVLITGSVFVAAAARDIWYSQ